VKSRKENKRDVNHLSGEPDNWLPGKITSMSPQTRNSLRVSVFIDGEFRFGCYRDAAAEAGLVNGDTLNPEMYSALLKIEERYKLKEYWLGLLSSRAHTSAELKRKARAKGISGLWFDELTDEFRGRGYIDDEKWAITYARSAAERKKWGKSRIKSELLKKGVDSKTADTAVSALGEEDSFGDMSYLIGKIRKRLLRESDILNRRRKAFDHLVRKGYAPADILGCMDKLLQHIEAE
jgi:regulatory protein